MKAVEKGGNHGTIHRARQERGEPAVPDDRRQVAPAMPLGGKPLADG